MNGKNEHYGTTVGFVALGCPKNMVDSEKMLANIGCAGFIISADIDNADVVIINTCGFIAPAKEEAVEAITEAIKQKQKGNVKKVIVTGCLSQRMGKSLADQVKGIDAIVGLGAREQIGPIITETLSVHEDQDSQFYLPEAEKVSDDRGRLLINPRHWAYLRISEGCSRNCSFCTIPAIRGKFRSKPQELVLSEARELVGNGAVELNIIAQDSASYGKDLGVKYGLINLIKQFEKIENLKWIRLMYLYPSSIDERLIEVIADSEKVVNYIDMPIQHINDDILKNMHRNDTKEAIIKLIENLRGKIPDVVLRTTLITGFPGETEQQFSELLEFVQWAKFDALGCFPFYAEDGTKAPKMAPQVSEQIKLKRLEQVMLAQQQIAFAENKARRGKQLRCLIDSIDNKHTGVGRFFGQAPHIDSVCYIENCSAEPGRFVETKVIDSRDYDLVVEQI
jgi:ribosomal protein S12 methylthiotransferase